MVFIWLLSFLKWYNQQSLPTPPPVDINFRLTAWYVTYFGCLASFLEFSLFLLPVTTLWQTEFFDLGNWGLELVCSFRIILKRGLFFKVWLARHPQGLHIRHCFHFSTIPHNFRNWGRVATSPRPWKWGFYLNIANLQSFSNKVIPIFLPTSIFIHLDLFKSGHLALRLVVRKCHKTDPPNVAVFQRAEYPNLTASRVV